MFFDFFDLIDPGCRHSFKIYAEQALNVPKETERAQDQLPDAAAQKEAQEEAASPAPQAEKLSCTVPKETERGQDQLPDAAAQKGAQRETSPTALQEEKPRAQGDQSQIRRQLQQELAESSRRLREIQNLIKESYQFEPCRQLCEVILAIRQKVYQSEADIQEDLGYVAEAFGITEFQAFPGDSFDPRYHEQVHSDFMDARGREIAQVYTAGFQMDSEILIKARVSVR